MRGVHHGLKITGEQRQAWADHMHAAAEEIGLSVEFRKACMPFIEGGSTFCQRVSWPRDQRWAR
jgi:truncated hemoglobin YjbI